MFSVRFTREERKGFGSVRLNWAPQLSGSSGGPLCRESISWYGRLILSCYWLGTPEQGVVGVVAFGIYSSTSCRSYSLYVVWPVSGISIVVQSSLWIPFIKFHPGAYDLLQTPYLYRSIKVSSIVLTSVLFSCICFRICLPFFSVWTRFLPRSFLVFCHSFVPLFCFSRTAHPCSCSILILFFLIPVFRPTSQIPFRRFRWLPTPASGSRVAGRTGSPTRFKSLYHVEMYVVL